MGRFAISSLVSLVFVLLVAPASWAVDFLSAIEDVPLPQGIEERHQPVVFETPFGRVIQATSEGKGNDGDVEDFYIQSLPALGWKQLSESLVFERREERLSISIESRSGRVRIKYRLTARPAPSQMIAE